MWKLYYTVQFKINKDDLFKLPDYLYLIFVALATRMIRLLRNSLSIVIINMTNISVLVLERYNVIQSFQRKKKYYRKKGVTSINGKRIVSRVHQFAHIHIRAITSAICKFELEYSRSMAILGIWICSLIRI